MTTTLSSREKKILLVTAGIALGALVYRFGVEPYLNAWQTLAADIRVAEARLQKTRLLLRKKPAIEEAFQKLLGNPPEAAEGAEEGLTTVLQEIEAMAQKSRLHVLGMRPMPQREKPPFIEHGVEIRAEGSAPQFAKFVYSLFHSPYALKIEKLELTSKAGESTLLKGLLVVNSISQ